MQGKSLKQNFFVYMLRNLMMMITPIIIFPYASRVLGVEGVGRVQFAQTTATYFELIAQFGIKSYAIREGVKIRDDRERFGKFVTELFIINLCTDAVAVISYAAAVLCVGSLQSYKGLLMIFLLEVIFSGLSFEWFYSILEDYVYITIRTTVFQALSLLVMIAFAHNETDLSVYAIALVLPYVGDSITNIFHSRKLVKLFGYKNYTIKKHAKAMFFIFSIILSTSLYTMMDTTMLGLMQGDVATGLYSAASKLNRLCVKLITAICAVFLPRLAYYRARDEKKGFQKLAIDVSNIILGLSVPACVGMFLLSKEIILIFSGAEFLNAIPAMRFMCVDLLFSSLNGFLAWQILAPCNREKWLFFATMMGALADFLLNMLLIPLFGTSGAAAATVFAEMVVLILCSLASRKYIPLRGVWKHLWQYLVASLPIIPICLLTQRFVHSSLAVMGISVVLSVLAYAGMLILLNNPYARTYIQEIFRILHIRKGEKQDEND